MATRKKAGNKTKKAATPARKKTVKKKTTAKKAAKSRSKKVASKKTTARRTAKKTTTATQTIASKESYFIEPGPPAISVLPVEEPAANEEAIGTVTHYYSHLGVAVVQIYKGMLRPGDAVHFKGHTTDFTQTIDSIEYEHQNIDQALPGQSVGIKISEHAREHDIVFLVK